MVQPGDCRSRGGSRGRGHLTFSPLDCPNLALRPRPCRHGFVGMTGMITTIEMAKAIATPGAFNPTLYDAHMVIAGGGVPIKAGNEVIGGIGVGGAPGGDKDEACANAGLAKIGDRLN
jgi:hypothetical protein